MLRESFTVGRVHLEFWTPIFLMYDPKTGDPVIFIWKPSIDFYRLGLVDSRRTYV